MTMTADEMSTYWMPFTANRSFGKAPRLFTAADGMFYSTDSGHRVLDSIAGLWCVNAGHARRPIIDAIKESAERLDFASSFQVSHPAAFELSQMIVARSPMPDGNVFLSNSGSEAVDTALKIARGYFAMKGEARRKRLIGRTRGYHGMGWGGLSVGGIGRHRRDFEPLIGQVDHIRHPYDPAVSRFSRGQPEKGVDYADDLTDLLTLHDPATVAAVIVEPVAGSAGVFPPPVGYLEKLRAVCDQHGILLIFDEVITGFGRIGARFAANRFGVQPDIITCAKGLSNGAVPIGATIVSKAIHDAYMENSSEEIELAHGYTYSGHPLACAAAIATIRLFDEEGLWTRVTALEGAFESAMHGLKEQKLVTDVRNIGLLAGIDLAPVAGQRGARAKRIADLCFDRGVLVRSSGDTLVISPPLIIEVGQIDLIATTIAGALDDCT